MHEEYIQLNSFQRCSIQEELHQSISCTIDLDSNSNDNKLSLINFIYENDTCLPDELCDSIIELFDYEDDKIPGSTYGGIQKKIKDTTDFNIPKKNIKWEKINSFLLKELHINLKLYHKKMKEDYKLENMLPENIFIENFMVQHYKKGIGKYIYHNDGATSYNLHKRRIVTYIFYLNDVDEGGETEFFREYRIVPKKGKIVLFPANWCYPHCGKTPLSSDKYIITGWVYTDET